MELHFLTVCHWQQCLLMRVDQKNFAETVFLKTTKIEKVNGSFNTIGHLKVLYNQNLFNNLCLIFY